MLTATRRSLAVSATVPRYTAERDVEFHDSDAGSDVATMLLPATTKELCILALPVLI